MIISSLKQPPHPPLMSDFKLLRTIPRHLSVASPNFPNFFFNEDLTVQLAQGCVLAIVIYSSIILSRIRVCRKGPYYPLFIRLVPHSLFFSSIISVKPFKPVKPIYSITRNSSRMRSPSRSRIPHRKLPLTDPPLKAPPLITSLIFCLGRVLPLLSRVQRAYAALMQ